MKHVNFRQVHKKREQTTNFPKDTHKDFCARCLEYHKGICPNGRKEECAL